MNLNKFTKAELISKLKQQNVLNHKLIDKVQKEDSNKISNTSSIIQNIKSYFTQIFNLFLVFKDILTKLTLISFFIQILKKYQIFRRLWIILNAIVMTIFGISLIDNFGFEFINNIMIEIKNITSNIVDYLTNTKFYSYLSNLFSNKEIRENNNNKFPSNRSDVTTNSIETARNEKSIIQSERNSKISEWLKNESNETEISEEIQAAKSNFIKYIIYGTGIIIVSGLSWYYWEELKSGGNSFLEWVWNNRPKPSSDSGSNTESSTTPTTMNLQTGSVNSRANSPDIALEDKTTILTSASLEDLNEKVKESWSERPTSPSSSTSSNETIKPTSSGYTRISWNDSLSITDKLKSLSSQGVDLLDIVKVTWRDLLNTEIRESMEYVENHFPKSELNDTKHIENLIHDIKSRNVLFSREILAKKFEMSEQELNGANIIAQETDKWINEIEEKLKFL